MAHTASGNATWQDYPNTDTLVTAASLENIENVLDGHEGRIDTVEAATVVRPVLDARLTTAYTGLASGDYVMSGNMTVDVDSHTMWTNSAGTNGYKITIPTGWGGRYEVDWHFVSQATTGFGGAKVLLNRPQGTAANLSVQNYSIFSNHNTAATGEGTQVHVRGSRVFAAGDNLALTVYSSVTFTMPVTLFGGIRTQVVVRYVGAT